MENCAWLCGILMILLDEDGNIADMAARNKVKQCSKCGKPHIYQLCTCECCR